MIERINSIIDKQKEFFKSGNTLNVKYRIEILKKLYKNISDNISLLNEAIHKDLGKSASEAYMCEIGMVLNSISFMIKNAKKLSKPRRARTPIAQFHSKSFQLPTPFGVVLVMSPWNYPFLLAMDPLVEAIASGNTVVLKPSRYSPNTSEAIKKIVELTFEENYACVFLGGRDVNIALMNAKFDYIFFTGSKNVGKQVYEIAAKELIPVTLELGGKSPCIIDKSCNLKLAAKRVVWGKFLNLGQTCVAPDYILCNKDVYDEFISILKQEIISQYTADPLTNPSYGKIINEKHFNRAISLIDKNKVYYGGKSNLDTLKIEPTIMINVTLDDAVMKEEIFAPILPIIKVDSLEETIDIIHKLEVPLAFYVFSKDKKNIKHLLNTMEFGGGCVNDVVIHLATSYMSFGGFKDSGIGGYHGKTGFDTFSHLKSIVDKKLWIDLPMRYQPHTNFKNKLIKTFLK